MGGGVSKSKKAVAPNTGDPPILSPIDRLSDAQLEEFREAFNMFDKDGGGSIDAKELKDLMASVGQMPTDAELADMIAAADADGTGDIDFTEFAALMAHKMVDEKSEKAIYEAFKIFDTSGDGLISSHEMRKIMVNLGEKVHASDVNTVIAGVDTDGDGYINYNEFTKVILEQTSASKYNTPRSTPRDVTSDIVAK